MGHTSEARDRTRAHAGRPACDEALLHATNVDRFLLLLDDPPAPRDTPQSGRRARNAGNLSIGAVIPSKQEGVCHPS